MKKVITIKSGIERKMEIEYEYIGLELFILRTTTWQDGGMDKIERQITDTGLINIITSLLNHINKSK